MQWYEGGIAEAVTLSRKNSLIFVVYIEGKDEKSKQIAGVIDNPEVTRVLQSDRFVAVKVEANSTTHTQFSEIYNNTPTPSIYFIGKNGKPVEIITEPAEPTVLVNKMNNIIIQSGGTPIVVKTENLLKNEASNDYVCDGDICVKKSTEDQPQKYESDKIPHEPIDKPANEASDDKPAGTSNEAAAVTLSIDEKLKLAQELIEKKRAQKQAEEEEKEREKEMERRKMGQDVLKMKRWQQDQEIKQRMEERQKEKREEQEARDRVKRQIEEDKREKAAKAASARPAAPIVPSFSASKPANSNIARLQFRLPDGGSSTHDFPSSNSLQDVIDYIKSNLNLGFANFVLSTTFPRREFSSSDASQSLLDLQLVPNAVILILPIAHGAVATNNENGLVGMFWYLFSPILNFFGYLKGLVFGTPAAESSRAQQKRPAQAKDSDEGMSRATPPKRRPGESTVRRQGNSNIHRLTDRDSDDDNNTWNGNSTQQM